MNIHENFIIFMNMDLAKRSPCKNELKEQKCVITRDALQTSIQCFFF